MSDQKPIFKVLTFAHLADFVSAGAFEGSADDLRDGFIHLSTDEQLDGTLEKHFAGERRLFLVLCKAELGPALRWDPSRKGEIFPHLYRALSLDDIEAMIPIPDERSGWVVPQISVG